ncbi:hypothetical protein MGN70_000292 [Eutypa lata]|uniref:DUF7918 domain-containing protein n=1 Tax=Eutypa lata (strain UCR-EL1) TaxID=1287681 RepID=M7SR84_EUTLA|nr:hypothetical protein UCREL1_5990 [Eutypa lata UCREL1]KAI1257252.1 hypothetical protein MGN70_000292 [Eutypa lata]
MAILEDVPGIKVTIRVGGVNCTEYDDPDAEDEQTSCSTSSKYIESVDDSEFSIHWEVNSDYAWGPKPYLLDADIYIDGHWLMGSVVSVARLSNIDGKCEVSNFGATRLCPETGSWVVRKPKFSAVKIVEDTDQGRIERDHEVVKELANITVKISRVIDGSFNYSPNNQDTADTSFELAEKSLKGKAISHGTTFSTIGSSTQKPEFAKVRIIPEDDGPIAVFLFKYRSKEALKHELIIPRSPSPEPAVPDDFAILTDAEKDRLARDRFEELKIKRELKTEPVIKREFGDTIDLTQDESPHRPAKRVARCIDLTED